MSRRVRINRVEHPIEAGSAVIRAGLVVYDRRVLGETDHFPAVFRLLSGEGETCVVGGPERQSFFIRKRLAPLRQA